MVAEGLDAMSTAAVNGESDVPNVRMRNSKPPSPLAANPSAAKSSANGISASSDPNESAAAALSRSMAVLQEVPPELEESSEGQFRSVGVRCSKLTLNYCYYQKEISSVL